MKLLGIESSCDETAAAVVEDGTRVLSNIVDNSRALRGCTAGWCRKLPPAATVKPSPRW